MEADLLELNDGSILMSKLKKSVINNINDLMKKKKIISIYKTIQIYGSLIMIISLLFYYYFFVGGNSFNYLMERYEFFFGVLIIFIFNIFLEKGVKPLKKEEASLGGKFKDSLTLKVCNCSGYCECKEELNAYMKDIGIKII